MNYWQQKVIEQDAPVIIAEAGINHNGEIEKALQMVRKAKEIGFSIIKFQTFKAEEFNIDDNELFTYQSQGKMITEPALDMFKRCEFTKDEWWQIKKECDLMKIEFMSTPQNYSDLQMLLELDVKALKVGSDDFVNLPLLKKYKATGLPLLLSCGMSDLGEIYKSLDVAGFYDNNSVALCLCTSQYPTPPKDVNLRKLIALKNTFPGLVVGFSDHTVGNTASIGAVALGAVIFEKHFTLDNSLPGPDHWFSENPDSLKVWYDSINVTWEMLGSSTIKPTKEEMEGRIGGRRSIYITKDIKCGEILSEDNMALFRPGNGLQPEMIEYVNGKKASKDMKRGHRMKYGDWIE